MPLDPPMLRLLVVMPSWLGDAVMATPTLRLIRRAFPGIFVGALCRPGIDRVLHGLDLADETHVQAASGVMGPKFAAAKLRPRRYDTALLLPNSFSSALAIRVAGIPRRIGYDRDSRGLLLTEALRAPRRADGSWAITAAVDYYHTLAAQFLLPALGASRPPDRPTTSGDPFVYATRHVPVGQTPLPPGCCMESAATPQDRERAGTILASVGIAEGTPLALLNPGGNNPAKRWPPDRFIEIGRRLLARGITPMINGSPAERDLARAIADGIGSPALCLPDVAPPGPDALGTLKALIARSRLMLTNDTGPRHLAAALGVPVVALFGPTDCRWTLIPTRPGAPETIITADPTLPPDQVANDHPQRCAIDRIDIDRVWTATSGLLESTQLPAVQAFG